MKWYTALHTWHKARHTTIFLSTLAHSKHNLSYAICNWICNISCNIYEIPQSSFDIPQSSFDTAIFFSTLAHSKDLLQGSVPYIHTYGPIHTHTYVYNRPHNFAHDVSFLERDARHDPSCTPPWHLYVCIYESCLLRIWVICIWVMSPIFIYIYMRHGIIPPAHRLDTYYTHIYTHTLKSTSPLPDLSVYLPACLPACRSLSPSVCLFACLYVCVYVSYLEHTRWPIVRITCACIYESCLLCACIYESCLLCACINESCLLCACI